MYLNKLEIVGFKSFANKTTVSFANGITAIVGPNGCGKTNILDALRWVLGEQRVSLLRGSRMEEVIFNGSRETPALGMAEVTLTVVNDRGVLPSEYNELQITRRLFRSGESEYLLNKVPCRLKDIAELFYDTGMGAHSYSVIQQDMIEAVISDKAEERRFLFEEAAGITKYKQRKRAALRKLEATEQDFLRLNDIYAEVKAQVETLKRQQKKAEKYQAIASEVKAWDLYLSGSRGVHLTTERNELLSRRASLQDQLLAQDTSLAKITAELEAVRTDQLALESSLNQLAGKIFEESEAAHASEREISVLKEKRIAAESTIRKNETDILAIREREAVQDQAIAIATEELLQLRARFENLQEAVRTREAEQVAADSALYEGRAARQGEQSRLIELEGKLSSGKTEDENLRLQLAELTSIAETCSATLTEKRANRDTLGMRHATLEESLATLRSQKSVEETEHARLSGEMASLVEQSDNCTEEISVHTASLEAAQARLTLLADMIHQYEGYGSGVVAVMDSRNSWPGLFGTVADRFVPAEGMEAALEGALGELAQYLLCDTRKTAESIVSWVRAEKKGRLGILVPDLGAISPIVKRPEIGTPGFLGWLDSFVHADDTLRPLMQSVLARTAVFEAGTDPSELLERLPFGFSAVSTDGICFGRNAVTGGSELSFPLFRRHERVEEQNAVVEQCARSVTTAKEEKSRIVARLAACRSDWATLAQQIESLSEQISQMERDAAEVDFLRRTVESEIERLERDRQQATERSERIRGRQYSLELDFGALASEKASLVGEISRAHEALDDLERAAAVAAEQVAKAQMAVIEERSRVEATEQKRRHADDVLGELRSTRVAKAEENDFASHEIESFVQRITELEIALKEHFTTRASLVAAQTALQARQAEFQSRVAESESSAREIRGQRDTYTADIHKSEIRLTAIDAELTSLTSRLQEEYDTELGTFPPESPDPTLSEVEAREILTRQRESLKRFGAVNLLALEEFETASQREQFLSTQLADLTAAKSDLKETITKINITARELFLETFAKVKENFQKLFVELFTGGEADIHLADPTNPLESDIEITARPRGKKILSITMMSGGERALTAISLLFSLYMVKPSPFCILDEIDAPLDDANCNRFLRMIRTFSSQTQFITITHNKITMAAADNLYGVTMEQPGVSKLVGVRFGEENDRTVALPAEAQSASQRTNPLAVLEERIDREDVTIESTEDALVDS